MTGKAKGYFLGAVAAATYGMNPLFALPLYDDGMDSDSVLFFRYLFAIPLLAIMLKARGRSLAIKRCEVAPLLFFGVMIALSSLTLFLSYGYGSEHRLHAAVHIPHSGGSDNGCNVS